MDTIALKSHNLCPCWLWDYASWNLIDLEGIRFRKASTDYYEPLFMTIVCRSVVFGPRFQNPSRRCYQTWWKGKELRYQLFTISKVIKQEQQVFQESSLLYSRMTKFWKPVKVSYFPSLYRRKSTWDFEFLSQAFFPLLSSCFHSFHSSLLSFLFLWSNLIFFFTEEKL